MRRARTGTDSFPTFSSPTERFHRHLPASRPSNSSTIARCAALDILRESWEASTKSSESMVSYVLSIQERLSKLQELAKANFTPAQKTQKTWYDRNARDRELQPGDQVLVLLPTSMNKLLAEWQGPYPVVCRVGRVVYEIEMKNRRRRKRRFHVSVLRKWIAPASSYFSAEDVSLDDDDMAFWERSGDDLPKVSDLLMAPQAGELQILLREFSDVLHSEPERTTIIEYTINVEDARPIRLAPYHLPHAYREVIYQELQEMEQAGVIVPSLSPWAALIVPVKKKDGSLRVCADLNAASWTNAYAMHKIDDLVYQLGGAQFITTLDLSKGYKQNLGATPTAPTSSTHPTLPSNPRSASLLCVAVPT